MTLVVLCDCPLLKLAVTAQVIGKTTVLQPQHIGNHLTNFHHHYINRLLVGIRLMTLACNKVTASQISVAVCLGWCCLLCTAP